MKKDLLFIAHYMSLGGLAINIMKGSMVANVFQPYMKSMKIVILDGYTANPGDLSWKELETLGQLIVYERTSLTDEAQIIERIADAEIVITNKTPITSNVIDSCPTIKYIALLATGYNVVDIKHAKKKNIAVSNVPAYGTAAVAQFAIGLLLEICHHIGYHAQTVAEGRWSKSEDFCYWDYPLIELEGKTIGIIGFGRIGQTTAKIAKSMGMKVLSYDTYRDETGATLATYVDLDTLLSQSDVISLHCPLFPETEGIINKASIEKMKDGVIIINNSRGPLIQEHDLADALSSGKVAAAAVDVASSEPIREDNPLLHAPNCLITPHISWGTKESRLRILDCTYKNIVSYMEGTPINVVNP